MTAEAYEAQGRAGGERARWRVMYGYVRPHRLALLTGGLLSLLTAATGLALPLVVRAIVPVLEELGQEQEQAAHTLGAGRWQTFRRITIPSIRWALGYGIVLCLARALGEYGAVAVVSGRLVGQTQTLTLFVEERFDNFDQWAAFAAATALALIAILTLLLTKFLRPKDAR